MFYFYVLYSLKDHKLYKGYSADIAKRFIKHNQGGNTSTKHRRPLVLIYTELFDDKIQALLREKWAKSPTGGPMLRSILIRKGILKSNGKIPTPKQQATG